MKSRLSYLRQDWNMKSRSESNSFFQIFQNIISQPQNDILRKYRSIVTRINQLEDRFKLFSDEELKDMTRIFRERLENGQEYENILEEAFAVTREVCRRTLGIRLYDVQLLGSLVLLKGNIAEMATGEGKTYVTIPAAYFEALHRKGGIFIITVNDYLARRDAHLVKPVYDFLSISLGIVDSSTPFEEKKMAYSQEIVYVTNSELGFDYLRDHLTTSPDGVVLSSSFYFAIVDEVDAVLIDEARTPLIISDKVKAPKEFYDKAIDVIGQLQPLLDYEVKEKEQTVILTERGMIKCETLLETDDLYSLETPWAYYLVNALKAKELFLRDRDYIVDQGQVKIIDTFTGRTLIGRRWNEGLHQSVEAKEGLEISEETQAAAKISYQSFFKLFHKLCGMTGTASTDKNEFQLIYNMEVITIPTAFPMIRKDYPDWVFQTKAFKLQAIIEEIESMYSLGRPILVGTTSIDASEEMSTLLRDRNIPHEVLNARPENASREAEIVSQAGTLFAVTISTNMSGRGTDIMLGGNPVHMTRSCIKELLLEYIRSGNLERQSHIKWNIPRDFIQSLAEYWKTTTSHESKECSDDMLLHSKTSIDDLLYLFHPAMEPSTLDPHILDLWQPFLDIFQQIRRDVEEQRNKIIQLGGLFVIGTERHESRRIDNQLRGRAGRQGDPGATRFFLSLEDRLFRIFGGDRIKGLMQSLRVGNLPIENSLVTSSLDNIQSTVEQYFARMRMELFKYDQVVAKHRIAIYTERDRILRGSMEYLMQRLEKDMYQTMEEIIKVHWPLNRPETELKCQQKLKEFFPFLQLKNWKTIQSVTLLEECIEKLQNVLFHFNWLEDIPLFQTSPKSSYAETILRFIYLQQLDHLWMDHLKRLDFIFQVIGLQVYRQTDPFLEYQRQAYDRFQELVANMRRTSIYSVTHYEPNKQSDL
ncbi:Protein translocase subunit SecA [Galdieria sulphuraria]|uniref:Protein translocase subunit SecA n=1 Tax=Galdieria sulphuraria TaxID=130081 RepID=M2WT92_GALSU|nr:preprotein translocase subunit A [Galdieria sulphuraria]EME27120.1 preprotein translocase subunit A [Galdieria sulphuraria]GJD05678.1 Protein translocase subunit SecA [Galdieria sulphuraria]|eukprot:XP_005703640.1 preprotein translocase subunit A [Galdieria sulphuraria]